MRDEKDTQSENSCPHTFKSMFGVGCDRPDLDCSKLGWHENSAGSHPMCWEGRLT